MLMRQVLIGWRTGLCAKEIWYRVFSRRLLCNHAHSHLFQVIEPKMTTSTEASTQQSAEEEDNLVRSTKHNKNDGVHMNSSPSGVIGSFVRPTYKDSLCGGN